MPVSTVTIDLGVIDDRWAIDADQRPSGLSRGWGLFGVVALLLSLVSAVPLPEPPHEVTRQPLRGGEFHLAGGALFVLESHRTPTPVQAFDARDGEARWTYTAPDLATLSYASVAGDLVVFSPDLCRSGVTGTTVGLDLRTGSERWRSTGVPVRTAPGVSGTVVLRSLWSDGCTALTAGTPTGGTLRWLAIDGAGRTLWETTVEPGTRVAVDSAEAGAGWAALLDKRGTVGVVDFATGARAATGVTAGSEDLVEAAGDLLVVVSATTLAAYDRRSGFAARWTVPLPAERTDHFAVRPCGRALCVVGRRTVVLDPATGTPLWTVPGRPPLTEVPGGLLSGAGASLLDPATGVALGDRSDWAVLGVAGPRLLLGLVSGVSGDDSTLLAWSTGGDPVPFATVGDVIGGCELDGGSVACRTPDDDVVLIRLPAR
ncbi:PQQ-binding-like beta-propeller repeat protein [Dactylosporangium sucinum]|uniref:Pyrrolo-quinoline quinone repeat domain-containing protein n=1 Tax=Dactylosporangium sucinum TaxID=1424081 RepID=A0A917UDP1_9ACTN|nr:PQQ-binding-like beta-propeller repeat protein [Dactylosporangium sucinum]GGM74753.1 hypothetical protein GCM10007977_090460 [Dactylosporangium sucinum]